MNEQSTSLAFSPEKLKQRRKTVGASEVAILFNLDPRKSAFQLALEKTGELPEPDLSDQEHIQAGVFMEPAIAEWARYRTNWWLTPHGIYTLHPNISGWSATPDYVRLIDKGEADQEVMGPVEIKRVSAFHREGWELDENQDGLEAPLHIELQLQAQLGVLGKNWGAVAADLAGKLKIIEREIDPNVQNEIAEKITAFWACIRRGDLPEPSDKDADTIKRLYSKAKPGKVLLATDSIYRKAIAVEEAREAVKLASERKTIAEAELLLDIQDSETVVLGDGRNILAAIQRRKEYVVKATEFRTIRFVKARPEI